MRTSYELLELCDFDGRRLAPLLDYIECDLSSSPHTGGGGAQVGLHGDPSTRGHKACGAAPGDPHLGPSPPLCSPRCSPRWGHIFTCP